MAQRNFDPGARNGRRCPRCGQVMEQRVGTSAHWIEEPHAKLEDCVSYLGAELKKLKKDQAGR